MKKTQILLILFLFVSSLSYSQVNIHSILQDTVNLDEVVITGTTVKVNRNNVPMAVSIVSPRQINESIETALLPVLNGRVPGLSAGLWDLEFRQELQDRYQ